MVLFRKLLTVAIVIFLTIVPNIKCFFHNNYLFNRKTSSSLSNQLQLQSKKALIIPIDSIDISYIDNTKLNYDSIFSDSFFIETANSILSFECRKYFSIHTDSEKLKEFDSTISQLQSYKYSPINESTNEFDKVSKCIRKMINSFQVDYIIFPYSCEIVQSAIKPQGWRNSPSYSRPIEYAANTKTHLQIWNKEGDLFYESIGIKKNSRPFLYTFLKKTKPTNDIVKYSKNFFAPPIIKSLSKSIKKAMNIAYK